MTPKRTNTDPGASRAFGTKPFTGRRFVSKGKVRIEWMESGRRRSRTIGPDSPDARAQADAEVEAIVKELRAQASAGEAPAGDAPGDEMPSVLDALRQLALAILDAADAMIDRMREELERDRDERPDGS